MKVSAARITAQEEAEEEGDEWNDQSGRDVCRRLPAVFW